MFLAVFFAHRALASRRGYELSLLFAGGHASASVSSHLSNRSVRAPCCSFSTRTFGSPVSQQTHALNDSRVIDAVRAAHVALCAAARAQPRRMGSDPRRTRTLHGPFAAALAPRVHAGARRVRSRPSLSAAQRDARAWFPIWSAGCGRSMPFGATESTLRLPHAFPLGPVAEPVRTLWLNAPGRIGW